MYGLFEVDKNLAQVTLPSPANVPLPFGFPPNVWVRKGAAPFVINTGHVAAKDALLAALAQTGVDPRDVQTVLLTSALPEALGNVGLFPNATIRLLADSPIFVPATAQSKLRSTLETTLFGLVDPAQRPEGAGHPDWSVAPIEAFLKGYFQQNETLVPIEPMREGEDIVLGDVTLRVVATPGVDTHACCLLDNAHQDLFGGETMVRTPQPRILDPKAFSASLDRLSPLRPDRILPAYGGLERSYFALFRSLNLAVANLVQNMPFALHGPTRMAEIAYNDLGFWPRDVVRFGGSVIRFQSMLDELVVSGIAERDGEGPWAVYAMERPSRT